MVAISCFATAFVPPTASPTTVSRNRIAPLTVLPSAQLLSARAPLDRGARDAVAALQMSDYDAGGYDGGGSQEVRMEMQELHVEFTGDGRILLEVKGVKVRSGRDGYNNHGEYHPSAMQLSKPTVVFSRESKYPTLSAEPILLSRGLDYILPTAQHFTKV